jgi:hypothetical protein
MASYFMQGHLAETQVLLRERITSMKRFTKNIGLLLLAFWLIATGVVGLVPVLSSLSPLLAILAVIAGIFILLGR